MTDLTQGKANLTAAAALLDALVGAGLRDVVISPGNRSLALTLVAAQHPQLRALPVLDERSAGFLALGIGKQTGRAAALICTSGTAVANYLPAVIEAAESGTPLLVLTADRPPELRACHAGQAIDQREIYGRYPRAFAELPTPGDARPEEFAAYAAAAWERAHTPHPGPVHLNLPFREPLAPSDPHAVATVLQRPPVEVFPPTLPRPDAAPLEAALAPWRDEDAGLVIAGPGWVEDEAVEAVARFAAMQGWPLLADPLSPWRHRATPATVVAPYDLLLAARPGDDLRPRVVVLLGDVPTSKPLRRFLATARPHLISVSPGNEDRNFLKLPETRIAGGPELFADLPSSGAPGSSSYLRHWRTLASQCEQELKALTSRDVLTDEPALPRHLARALPVDADLLVASSMPIRDVEAFWPAEDHHRRLFGNRGANGIDGTLSTALGLAQGNPRPVYLLTGDLALLHDTNGLLSAGRIEGRLVVVVVDNGGGQIFARLPVSRFEPPFRDFFLTPQAVDGPLLARAFGVECAVVDDRDALSAALLPPARGVRLVWLRSDPAIAHHARRAVLDHLQQTYTVSP